MVHIRPGSSTVNCKSSTLLHNNQPHFSSDPATKTIVLIISDFRSGSSLLGEMFNQNDQVIRQFLSHCVRHKLYKWLYVKNEFLLKIFFLDPGITGVLTFYIKQSSLVIANDLEHQSFYYNPAHRSTTCLNHSTRATLEART